jgi:hypothetical protein
LFFITNSPSIFVVLILVLALAVLSVPIQTYHHHLEWDMTRTMDSSPVGARLLTSVALTWNLDKAILEVALK